MSYPWYRRRKKKKNRKEKNLQKTSLQYLEGKKISLLLNEAMEDLFIYWMYFIKIIPYGMVVIVVNAIIVCKSILIQSVNHKFTLIISFMIPTQPYLKINSWGQLDLYTLTTNFLSIDTSYIQSQDL